MSTPAPAWPIWPDAQKDVSGTTKEAETRTVLLQEYGDHGQWARHYSAVRMTLGTFFLTAATGMITFRWDSPKIDIAVIAGAVLAIGVVLFKVFSDYTFDEMNKQRKIVDAYKEKLCPSCEKKPKLGFWKWGSGWPIAALFVGAFLVFDLWWFVFSKPQPRQVTQVTVPLKVKVGQQPEVTVDVPIKVTAP